MSSSNAKKTDEAAPETRALHEEIERTRGELGDTVEALAAKADVKARARETGRRLTTGARNTAGTARFQGGAAVAAALAVALWAFRRRRR